MPITLGSKPQAGFTDPIGLLSDCHRRIERFLSALISVAAQARGGELTKEHREAVEVALRYFKQAAPRHTADEEESLFPRIRRLPEEEARDVVARLESLNEGHATAADAHLQVEVTFDRWLSEGRLSSQDWHKLNELLAELSEFYRGHMAIEEGEIFPLAARLLSKEDLQRIGREMAERRGLSGTVHP
jgi:hemerythrin-like domain-containing protein